MAKLEMLHPAVSVMVGDVQLLATEAGRTTQGLTAMIVWKNGAWGDARTIAFGDKEEREALALEVAERNDLEGDACIAAMLELLIDVEAQLRPAEGEDDSKRLSAAARAAGLVGDWELFHDGEGVAYASFTEEDVRQTHRLNTRAVRNRLQYLYWQQQGEGMRAQTLQDLLGLLAGRAQFEGAEQEVFIRLTDHEGAIYVDLGDASWAAVRITGAGWEVVASTDLPVRFRRARGMLALPVPERGGTIDELRPFLNVPTDKKQSAAWVLKIAWLLGAMQAHGPYPILNIEGEQGSAKSTEERVLRSLIDPNTAPLRSQPREERDLVIAANNAWIVAFDNISTIKDDLSDALCRLATGGGFGTRELYTDAEEALFHTKRPIILDGISAVGTRPDFLDRTLLVVQQTIAKKARKPEAEFWADFERARPRILAGLLDAVSCALRRKNSIVLEELPRMADFAVWATAAEPALGWPDGTMMEAYDGNRAEANSLALQASVLAAPLWTFAQVRSPWTGTATQLLAALNADTDDQTRIRRERSGWPKAPHVLSSMLTRIIPNLREIGLEITQSPSHRKGRLITIERSAPPPDDDWTTPPWEKTQDTDPPPAPCPQREASPSAAQPPLFHNVWETDPQKSVPRVPSVPPSVNQVQTSVPTGQGSVPTPPTSVPTSTSFTRGEDAGDAGDALLHDHFPPRDAPGLCPTSGGVLCPRKKGWGGGAQCMQCKTIVREDGSVDDIHA